MEVPSLLLEVGRLDVGRVRDDQLVRAAGEAVEEVMLDQLNGKPGSPDVLAREVERVGRDVDRGHARARMLVRDRERDRPRAGADVQHARLLEPRDVGERPLDDNLRLRPRDQRAPVDCEREPPETPLAEDVGDRLVPRAPRDELAVGVELLRAERPVEVGVELDPLSPERMGE